MVRFIWKKGLASIEFMNGSMLFFDNDAPALSLESVKMLRYDMVVKVRNNRNKPKTFLFRVRDCPKVHYMGETIDRIVNFDAKSDGYLLETYEERYRDPHSGEEQRYARKRFYHQVELEELNYYEYFIRIDKYVWSEKHVHQSVPHEWTEYKMTIGEFPLRGSYNNCEAAFIADLTDQDLIRLKDTANDFVTAVFQKENTLRANTDLL